MEVVFLAVVILLVDVVAKGVLHTLHVVPAGKAPLAGTGDVVHPRQVHGGAVRVVQRGVDRLA